MSERKLKSERTEAEADPEIVELQVDGHSYRLATPHATTDYIQKKLHQERLPYEHAMLKDMARRLKEGDLVLDIGAHIGNHAVYLAVISGCRVVAFEPNGELARAIGHSAKLNRLGDRLVVEKVALGRAESRGGFEEKIPANLGAQKILVGKGKLKVVPLSSFDFKQSVAMMKIDVEGMELDVLEGASETIEKDRPILYVESRDKEGFDRVHAWLKERGYWYQETFNATPTHLFIHEDEFSLERLNERVLLKLEQTEFGLRSQVDALQKRLEGANASYREANTRIATLKAELENAREKYRLVTGQLEQARKQAKDSELKQADAMSRSQQLELAFEVAQTKIREIEHQRSEAKTQIKGLESVLAEARKAYDVAEKRAQTLEAESERVRLRERDLTRKLELSETEHVQSRERERDLARKLELSEAERVQNQEWKRDLARELELANGKYRAVTGEQIPRLKQLHEEKISSLSRELLRVRQQYARALTRNSRILASRTYQLGYSLRAAATSWRGALRLPIALWNLARRKRRLQETPARGTARPLAELRSGALRRSEPRQARAPVSTVKLAKKVETEGIRNLRVACIMDEFTRLSFAPECRLFPLTPSSWQQELEFCHPDILFIESAWRGRDKLWSGKIGHACKELRDIMHWCSENSVPTVFWNKEDPTHFETFLNTARLFDYVFTTDIDCIQRYKAALGHDRIYLLPFACQPALHNPIEKYQRKDAFCFAGAYYVRYPERTRDLESFVSALPGFRPLEIFDRNHGKDDLRYSFTEQYRPFIRGTLPPEEIDKAYKGYRYGINLNSIKQSQSMFARRVFELLASNTLTVSNYARGLTNLLGELVVATDSGEEARRRLESLRDSGSEDRLRLAGVRKVLQEHTYGERLRYMLTKVTGVEIPDSLPGFRIVGAASTIGQLKRLIEHARRQEGVKCALTVILDGSLKRNRGKATAATGEFEVDFRLPKELRGASLADLAVGEEWIAPMEPDDYYGPHYLQDIALGTRYTAAPLIGKGAFHVWEAGQGRVVLQDGQLAYREVDGIAARRAAISPAAAGDYAAIDTVSRLDTAEFSEPGAMAIDPFNYCEGGAVASEPELVRNEVDDLHLDSGVTIESLLAQAEKIRPLGDSDQAVPYLDAVNFVRLLTGRPFEVSVEGACDPEAAAEGIRLSRNRALRTNLVDGTLEIESSLADGRHEYIHAKGHVSIGALIGNTLTAEEHEIPLHLELEPGLAVSLVVFFLDAELNRIGHVIEAANRNATVHPPDGTEYFRLGLRVFSSGQCRIRRLMLGHRDLEPAEILGHSDVLLLTNNYPSHQNLYKNAFVHSRARAYREQGQQVDVFRLREQEPISWYGFESIEVTTGSQEALRRMLARGRYRHVLVHFLNPGMWLVLEEFIDRIPVTVWMHGAEIHPWYRRKFNLETPEDEERAKAESEVRMAFWRTILNPMPKNLHFVFVSRNFANEVIEDIGLRLPDSQFSVIHNPIDTRLFSYVRKPREQCKRILSIRPFASRQYANDLAVDAILRLSRSPGFGDMEFRLIGDGKHFDEITRPLKGMDNVIIERRFLIQSEISELHKEYGIFLCPTRWDSQGVSRDEAMASGLVPVTTRIAAVPEFVDETCAILAEPEDHLGLADGIRRLSSQPDVFLKMSENAAKRVRSQRCLEDVIEQEMRLFS